MADSADGPLGVLGFDLDPSDPEIEAIESRFGKFSEEEPVDVADADPADAATRFSAAEVVFFNFCKRPFDGDLGGVPLPELSDSITTIAAEGGRDDGSVKDAPATRWCSLERAVL